MEKFVLLSRYSSEGATRATTLYEGLPPHPPEQQILHVVHNAPHFPPSIYVVRQTYDSSGMLEHAMIRGMWLYVRIINV